MATVTISRQLGSGGDEIGQAVARELRAPYLDKEIIHQVAARLGIPDELAAGDGDQEQLLKSRLLGALLLYDPEVAGSDGPSLDGPSMLRTITSEQVRQVLEEVMREAAARGNAVIAGRSGQMILRAMPHVLHVHICAPLEKRVEQLTRQRGLGPSEARRLVRIIDGERAEYVQATYGVDWQSPDLYDLIINTQRLSPEVAVAVIVSAARALETAAPPRPDAAYQRLRQEMYTPREAADLLMISLDVIRHAVFTGELRAARAGGDMISIERHDLLAWLENQRAEQA